MLNKALASAASGVLGTGNKSVLPTAPATVPAKEETPSGTSQSEDGASGGTLSSGVGSQGGHHHSGGSEGLDHADIAIEEDFEHASEPSTLNGAPLRRMSSGQATSLQGSSLEPSHDELPGEPHLGQGFEEFNVESFDELRLDQMEVEETQASWRLLLSTAESREVVGEAIYATIFEAAPTLRQLFSTPRTVQAMKFMNEMHSFITELGNPAQLKTSVETLGFGHLHLDVTTPRLMVFRDAILDQIEVELADNFTPTAKEGWRKLLHYIGGAMIFVKAHYAERITTLLESWRKVNGASEAAAARLHQSQERPGQEGEPENSGGATSVKEDQAKTARRSRWRRTTTGSQGGREAAEAREGQGVSIMGNAQVPTSFTAMFRFNAAVMGFGHNLWLNEVLAVFDNIVKNVSNTGRLQEECDVLVLRISKVGRGAIPNFPEFKSCMLASLRSLLPREWSTTHEVAWSWLWDNVERLMGRNIANPPKWEKALEKMWASLDDASKYEIRKEIYAKFFHVCPAGQDLFKQSNTYLHFIAERVMAMSLEIYKDPVKLVDDISALGLRHVGYAIPTELFGPFVAVCVEIIYSKFQKDTDGVDAFRWGIALISKMLVRVIMEGSTIVMKAINMNSAKMVRSAVRCAPRAERASWMLIVQVGTQSISPLAWAIDSGSFEAAGTMIQDLLTIRADRDRYYCGMDDMFKRHPDLLQKLSVSAVGLITKLLDLLIWRSRTTENGQRRVNYYVKHLLVDEAGDFSGSLNWIAKTKDPKLVCHEMVVLTADLVWSKVACRTFLFRKLWFLFTLCLFIAGESVLRHLHTDEATRSFLERKLMFAARAFIYCFSMTQLMISHSSRWAKAYYYKQTVPCLRSFRVPKYLFAWQEVASFMLLISLVLMLILEPILWCMSDNEGRPLVEECHNSKVVLYEYSGASMVAMVLYFALLVDLAALSTKVSAYVLVCIRLLYEVWLFVLLLTGVMLCFSSCASALDHHQDDFHIIPLGMLRFLQGMFNMKYGDAYDKYNRDPIVAAAMYIFLIISSVFFSNMLVAQLTCAYETVYTDMVGYARLERVEITVATMNLVPKKRWRKFIASLKLDEKLEFGPGDLGISGGFQRLEPALLNPVLADAVIRHGGSTQLETPWPSEEKKTLDEKERMERLEKWLSKALKRANKEEKKAKTGGAPGQASTISSGSGSQSNSTIND